MKIWILTVIAIIALYECVKHLITLIIAKSIRYSMVFLFCLSIFSHYYAWWAYVNYYNDDFYSQWNHQMFFTVSEDVESIKYSLLHIFRLSLHLRTENDYVFQIKIFTFFLFLFLDNRIVIDLRSISFSKRR